MADLTNAKIANTYKDLLQVNAETSNAGLDGTVRTIQDGGGTASPIAMSTAQLNVTGQFALGGTVLTATADQLNDLAVGKLDTLTAGDDTVKLTIAGVSVSTATVSATVVVNPVLSLTEVDAATGSFNTQVSATNFIAGTGSFTTKVSGVAAEFSGNVSAANVYASTNIFVGGTAVPSAAAITSINTVIAAVSALTSVNKAAITSINAGPASTFDALSVKTSITIGGTGSGNGVKALNVESLDSYSILEVGGATGGYVDLKKPFSDDFDIRLGTTGAGGHIKIGATGQTFEIAGTSETLATFTDDGSVALYHNNVKKLETAADGVDVDDINLNGKVLTITGDTDDTFKITAGANGATTLETVDTAGAVAHLTLDADGKIFLDSADTNGRTNFKSSGTSYGEILNAGDHLFLKSVISDGNIVLQGIDGGASISALTLDMSEAGKATFNSDVITGDINLAGKVLTITGDTDDTFTITTGAHGATTLRAIDTAGELGTLTLDADGRIFLDAGDAYGGVYFEKTGTSYAAVFTAGTVVGFQNLIDDGSLKFQGYDSGSTITALDLQMANAGKAVFNAGATFADAVTVEDISLDGKVLTITGDTDDTFKITTGANGYTTLATVDTAAANGHLVLDVDGQINLDAGDASGATLFKSSGTHYGTLYNSGSNLYLKSEVSDGNIIFKGNDGGVSVTPLLLDMSDAGKAYFYAGAVIDGDVTLTGDAYNVVWDKSENSLEFADNARAKFGTSGDLEIWHDGLNSNIKSGGAGSLIISSNFSETAILVVPNGQVRLYYDNAQKLETTATGATVTGAIVADSATVDDIVLDGKVITITGDTDDTFKITSGANGATTLATVDTAGGSAHLTVDTDGLIILDSGGSEGITRFQNNGTLYGEVLNSGDNFYVRAQRPDGDLILQGETGGSFIDALRLDMSEGGDATFLGSITAPSQEYTNSLKMSFSQRYSGNATGSYFTNGEFQKIATIIPSANYENYTIIGRMAVQQGSSFQNVNFNVGLRSNALPDLEWNIYYDEENSASSAVGIKPQIWTKETTTAGFVLAFEVITSQITGTVTVDFDIIPRNASRKADVTMNTVEASEQAAVDTGYTVNDMIKVKSVDGDDTSFTGEQLKITGAGNKAFHVESTDAIASMELGGTSGAFIDLKRPFSDDFDFRLASGGAGGYIQPSSGQAISILGGSGRVISTFQDQGSVVLYHNNVAKLTTTANGVDVDDINLNGKVLTITGDTSDTFTITTGAAGATTLATTDAAGADGTLILAPDGGIQLNAGSAGGPTILKASGTRYGTFVNGGNDFYLRSDISDGDMILQGYDGGSTVNALTLDMSEAGKAIFNAGATFADDVTVEDINLSGKVLTITGDTDDTFKITSGAAGATTLATTDAAGESGHLKLNPDGKLQLDVGNDYSEISLQRQGGDIFMQIFTDNSTSGQLYIKSAVADADFKIVGNDGGSSINALVFDMSDAGAAYFNNDVNTSWLNDNYFRMYYSDDYHMGMHMEADTRDLILYTKSADSSGDIRFETGSTPTERMTILSGGNVGIGTTAPSELLHIASTGDATIKLAADTDNSGEDDNPKIVLSQDGDLTVSRLALTEYNNLELFNQAGGADLTFGTSNSEKMRIKSGGNVGIGTTGPLKTLHVDGPALSTVQTLTDASTVTSDFDVGQNFTLTLAGNRTLGAPSNVDAGQVGSIFIIQDGTGSRTLAYNSIWKFAGGTAPVLSTAAGAIDRLDYIVQSGTAIQAVLTKAYA